MDINTNVNHAAVIIKTTSGFIALLNSGTPQTSSAFPLSNAPGAQAPLPIPSIRVIATMPSATGLSSMEGSTSFSCSLDIQKSALSKSFNRKILKILEVAQLPSTIALNAHPTLYVVQREPEYALPRRPLGTDPLEHVLKSFINGVPSQRPRSIWTLAPTNLQKAASTTLAGSPVLWHSSNDEGPLESRSNFGVTTILRTPIIQVLPSTQHSFQRFQSESQCHPWGPVPQASTSIPFNLVVIAAAPLMSVFSDDSHPYINIAPPMLCTLRPPSQ
ncbi:hypothetical protein CPB84DRAFT_1854505 [Gymnopilus junonius]|uniref:Uncharacterized protein n=1 Tax=Gymnopilus junonius TaxID=109634 RepID=A0A9P5N8P4_GYMJU|nr:hypothetical protein CPB84DRAFT_1854505 [Gymnopilus junonius]